jgi:hypothetical protein
MRYARLEYAKADDLFGVRSWIPDWRFQRLPLVRGPRRITELYIWWRGTQYHFRFDRQ